MEADFTQILSDIKQGDSRAADKLFPIIYEQLRALAKRRMSHERRDHTLQGTALVHEAYLRLIGGGPQHWKTEGHFFAAAAEAMRRILIESARRKKAIKRGEKAKREAAEVIDWLAATNWDQDLLLDIDEGLTRLSQEDDIAAALVKMRLFAGLSVTDAGRMLGMSRSAAYRAWDFARSWFAVNAVGLSDCPPESPTPA